MVIYGNNQYINRIRNYINLQKKHDTVYMPIYNLHKDEIFGWYTGNEHKLCCNKQKSVTDLRFMNRLAANFSYVRGYIFHFKLIRANISVFEPSELKK